MYNKEKERYEIEMSSYVGASSQFGYIQQDEGTQNEATTYFDQVNNVSNHHHNHDDDDEVRSSLTTAETSRVATTSTLGSPYNNNHSYEQYINENERGIGSEFEEEEFVEKKDDVKLDNGEDEYESDTGSEMIDELAPEVNYNSSNKRRHSRAEREEAMECEDEVRMEDEENEKKDNEGEAADNKEENIVNETGASENDEI
jgi:hypothetical protein